MTEQDGPSSPAEHGSDKAARAVEGLSGDDRGTGPAALGGMTPGDLGQGAGALDARNQGGGGTGMGQSDGAPRLDQTSGRPRPGRVDSEAGGSDALRDELRAHGDAQSRADAADAQGLLDPARSQAVAPGSDPNNDNL